jgi:hypothetical protein
MRKNSSRPKSKTKIRLTPALRMESETQAIQRKLEEMKKSLRKKKGNMRNLEFSKKMSKNFW